MFGVSNKQIIKIITDEDLKRVFPVLKELRPHLSFNEFREIFQQSSKTNDFQIVAIEVDRKIVALMGFRFLWDFVRGKHLYIDDLVITEDMRSQGLGAEFLNFAEKIASDENCKTLRLCTGIKNERAISFYEFNGWTKQTFSFIKKINF